jgi:hypothetical protein
MIAPQDSTMPTYSPSRRVARTGRPLGMLDVLSKVLDTGLAALGEWAQARRAAQLAALRSAAAREAQRSAAAVRRLADRQRDTSPGFASDLYAAADQHERAHSA